MRFGRKRIRVKTERTEPHLTSDRSPPTGTQYPAFPTAPLPRGPHLEFVKAALSCQVRNPRAVLSWGPQGTESVSSIPRRWLGSEGGVQHGKVIKARNVGRIKWNHVWNGEAWAAERALPGSPPRSLRWPAQGSARQQELSTHRAATLTSRRGSSGKTRKTS